MGRRQPLRKTHGVYVRVSNVKGMRDRLNRFDSQIERLENEYFRTDLRMSEKKPKPNFRNGLLIKSYSLKLAIVSIEWKKAVELLAHSKKLGLNQDQISKIKFEKDKFEKVFETIHEEMEKEKLKPKVSSRN